MPSISQAKLSEMEQELHDASADAARNLGDAHRAEARVRTFDMILDKINRAARGVPLRDQNGRNDWGMSNGYALSQGFTSSCGHERQPTEAEMHRQEVQNLNARIVDLETRIAAVVAVTTFAQDHKA